MCHVSEEDLHAGSHLLPTVLGEGVGGGRSMDDGLLRGASSLLNHFNAW